MDVDVQYTIGYVQVGHSSLHAARTIVAHPPPPKVPVLVLYGESTVQPDRGHVSLHNVG
jgi:hypothetical protein